jgi:hypothetical protein
MSVGQDIWHLGIRRLPQADGLLELIILSTLQERGNIYAKDKT